MNREALLELLGRAKTELLGFRIAWSAATGASMLIIRAHTDLQKLTDSVPRDVADLLPADCGDKVVGIIRLLLPIEQPRYRISPEQDATLTTTIIRLYQAYRAVIEEESLDAELASIVLARQTAALGAGVALGALIEA